MTARTAVETTATENAPATAEPTAPIARIWRGATAAKDADAYLAYLHETGLSQYRATPGNRGVLALRRIVEDRAEFMLLTVWESEEAIRRFAGDDIGRAVFYPEDERFLVERDERVAHYELVYEAGRREQ